LKVNSNDWNNRRKMHGFRNIQILGWLRPFGGTCNSIGTWVPSVQPLLWASYLDSGEGDWNEIGSPTHISVHPTQAVCLSSTNRLRLSARLTNRVLFSGRHIVLNGVPSDNCLRNIAHSTPIEKIFSAARPSSEPSSMSNDSANSNCPSFSLIPTAQVSVAHAKIGSAIF